MKADLPNIIKKDLHGRDGNHVKGINEDHFHEGPTGQIGYGIEQYPEDREGSQTAEEHTYRTDDEIDAVLHASFDILRLDHYVDANIFAERAQVNLRSREEP